MARPTYRHIRLRTALGGYASAVGLGGGIVDATGAQGDPSSRFVLVDLEGEALISGNKVQILAPAGQWIGIGPGLSTQWRCDRLSPGSTEVFRIALAAAPDSPDPIADGAEISLKASNGRWLGVGATATEPMGATAATIGTAQRFRLELAGAFDVDAATTGADPAPPLDHLVQAVQSCLYTKRGEPRETFARSHVGGSPIGGARDDDWIQFGIGPGETFERAELVITSSRRGDAHIAEQPAAGTSGPALKIKVHWWFEGGMPGSGVGRVEYEVRIFATIGPDVPATTVAVFRHGRMQLLRGFGWLDRERTRLALPSTMMMLASVDKPVTRVAVEQWMAASGGTIRKRTPVFPFLRGLGLQAEGGRLNDDRVDRITFQHLLDGASGLNDAVPERIATADEQAAWCMAQPLVHEPGADRRYPNLEFDLLRFAILRHQGGRAGFLAFLREQVFAPVGSRDVDLLWEDPAQPNPREPWYRGGQHRLPDRHLLLTSSAEALGRLFSRHRIADGRLIATDHPTVCAMRIVKLPTRGGVQTRPMLRINCGGPTVTVDGQQWSDDSAYCQQGIAWESPGPIAGTTGDVLYQTLRYGNLAWHIPVANGTWDVTLMFAETYHSAAGKRVFNLSINDDTVLSGFDIVQQAGGARQAVERTVRIRVADGRGLDIAASPNWGAQTYFGGLPGTTAMVDQWFDKGLVNIALMSTSRRGEEMQWVLRADALIGTDWP